MTDFFDRQDKRRAAAEGPFQKLCMGFLHLAGWSTGRTASRLDQAMRALREYRDAHGQGRNMGHGETILAVRVVADELAAQIQEAASGGGQDEATIAWVLAGLRCPDQPFCTGCRSCVTAPNRPIDGAVGVDASRAG